MSEPLEPVIIQYSGPPFRPPGWDKNPNNPHYPVPEFSSYGLFMGLFLFIFFMTKRRRKVYNKASEQEINRGEWTNP